MTDEKLKALAEKAPKDFGPNDDTWRYIEAVGPEVVLKLLARIAALRAALPCVYVQCGFKTKCADDKERKNDPCLGCAALKADDEAQND